MGNSLYLRFDDANKIKNIYHLNRHKINELTENIQPHILYNG